jgi:hypothetical protein
MRVIVLFVLAVLGVAVVAEGAYIVRTRTQMATLEERLATLATERESNTLAASQRRFEEEPAEGQPGDDNGPRPSARTLPPPKLVVPSPRPAAASADPLPMPAGLDAPEAREQLRQFILAQLERERQEAQQRVDQRREDRDRQRNEQMAKTLGLAPAETEKMLQILGSTQQARQDLRARIQSGEVRGDAIRQEMQALRGKADQDLQALLGDDRMQKLNELRRQGGGDNGPRGFGAFNRPGFPGGGPPPGGPPGTAPAN